MVDWNKLSEQTFDSASKNYQSLKAGYNRFSQSTLGRPIAQGFGEAYGWQYKDNVSQGFLGWKGTEPGRQLQEALRLNQGLSYKNISEGVRSTGRGSVAKLAGKTGLSILKRPFGLLAPAMTAAAMYSGYQQGGVTEALKQGFSSGAEWAAFSLATKVLGGTALYGIGAITAAGYGAYQFGQASRQYRQRLRHIEMGASMIDPFGTSATLRQRSLQALNNSHINGRLAVGNEAILLHDGSYQRR